MTLVPTFTVHVPEVTEAIKETDGAAAVTLKEIPRVEPSMSVVE